MIIASGKLAVISTISSSDEGWFTQTSDQLQTTKPINIHFKMESLSMMRDLLRQNNWIASIDLNLSVAV